MLYQIKIVFFDLSKHAHYTRSILTDSLSEVFFQLLLCTNATLNNLFQNRDNFLK